MLVRYWTLADRPRRSSALDEFGTRIDPPRPRGARVLRAGRPQGLPCTMRPPLLVALLLGCRGDKNDLGVTPGCPTQFDDPDPIIREGIRRRLNELDLPPEERPKYRWPNRTEFKFPGDDPPLWHMGAGALPHSHSPSHSRSHPHSP